VGREGNCQKGGLSPEGQSNCEIQQKVKVRKLFYPRKEATKERVTRECHVKNVVIVTASNVTAIPYLLVDNFSLGKR
jgi:hypothetical protein